MNKPMLIDDLRCQPNGCKENAAKTAKQMLLAVSWRPSETVPSHVMEGS